MVSRILSRRTISLLVLIALFLWPEPILAVPHKKPHFAVGDPLPRNQYIDGYTSTIFAEGLSSPHGIILFIGDGMGAEHRKAAQWLALGQSGLLNMDNMPVSGWSQTTSANAAITDSAAAATAMATGVKTNNGVIGQTPEGYNLRTILERAQAEGRTVGLVTTTQMAHATPAGFAAHVDSRSQMTEYCRSDAGPPC